MAEKRLTGYQRVQLKSEQTDSLPIVKEIFVKKGETQTSASGRLKLQDNSIMHLREAQASGLGAMWMATLSASGGTHMYLCSTLENRQKLTMDEVQSFVWKKERVLLNGIVQECIVAINLSDLYITRNIEDEKDTEAIQEQITQQIAAKETAQESKTDRENERYIEKAKDEPKVSNVFMEADSDESDADEDVDNSDSEDKNKALVEKSTSILEAEMDDREIIFSIREEIKRKLENSSFDFKDILEVFVEGSSKLVLDWKKVKNLDDLIKLIHISIKEKTISSNYYNDNIVLYNRFNRLIESVTKLDEQLFYLLCFKIMLIYGLDIGHICDIFDFILPSKVNSTVLKILKTMRNKKSKDTWFTEYVKKPWIIQNMEVYNDDIDLDQLADLPWTLPTYTLFDCHFIEKDTKSLMSIIEGISDTFYTSLSQEEVMNNLIAPSIDKKLAVGVSGIQKRLRGCRSLFNDFHCGEFFHNVRHIILNPEREDLVASVIVLFYDTFAKHLDLQKNVARTICAVFCQSLLFEATDRHTKSFLNFDFGNLRGLSKLKFIGNYQTSFVNEVFTANKEEQTSIEECTVNVREEYRYHFEKDNELIYKLFTELPKKSNLNNMTKKELEKWEKDVFDKKGKEYTDAFCNDGDGGLNAPKDKFKEHIMIVRILQSMAATIPKFSLRKVQLATLILFLFYKNKLITSRATTTKGILGQVYTGEGKTAIVAMIAAYHALNKKKVDIITSSEELIDEPLRNFSSFYVGLGLVAAALKQSAKLSEKVHVVYGTVQNFIGEQLRKQKTHPNSEICFPNRIVVVDEVDNMLYDRISSMVQLTGEETSILTPLIYPVLFEIYFRVRECYVDFELTEGENESSEQQLLKALEGEFYTNEELKPKYMEQLESLPEYLRQYCCLQYRSWISNCYKSILRYSNKESYHKDKKTGENIKIDASNTGVLQRNTHLADGLQQFLSLKENTLVDPLSLTASFASISSYIHKYNEVYGLTGTLGDKSTKDFFRDQYKVATVAIPSNFLSRLCAPEKNKDNGYRCYEYKPMRLSKRQDWVTAIVASVEQHITLNRPVLIICQSPLILEKTLEPAIRKMLERTSETEMRFEKPKIKKYSALTKLETTDLLANDILIATNIAGRGIDLRVTNKEVLKNGGLHVCLTYLPKTLRVERQCIGRTARAGQPGTGQLIIFDRDENKTVDDLKNDRKHDIERQITIAKDLIERNTQAEECSAIFREELSRRFSEVYDDAESKIEELNSRPSQKKTKKMIAEDARLAKARSELSMYQQKWAYWMQGHVFSRLTATKEIAPNHKKFMDRLFNKEEDVLAKEHYCFVAMEAFELLKQNSYRETTLFDDFDEIYDLAEEENIGLQHAGIAFYYYAGYLAQQEKPKDILKQLSKIKFFLQKSKEYIDEVIVHHFKTICEGILNDGLIFNQMDGVYQIFDDLSRRIGRNISRVAQLIENGNPDIQTKCVVTDLVDVGAITRLTMDNKYNNSTEVFLGSSIFKHCRVFGLVGLLNFDDEERRNRRRFIPVSLINIFYRQVLMRIYLRAQALRQVLDVRQKPRAVEGVIPQKYQENNIYACISLGRNLKYECFLEQKEAEPSDLRKVHRELFRLNMGLISYSGNRDARKLFFEYRTRGGIQRNGWLNSTANLDEIELPEFMKEFEDEVQDIIQDLKDYYEKSYGQDHHQKMVNGFHKHLTDTFECAFQLDVFNGNRQHEDSLINKLKKKLEKKNSILKGFLGEVENAKGNKQKHIKQYRKGIKNAFNKKLIKIWNERKQFLEDINNFDEDKIKQVEQRLNDFFVILANPIDELALGDQDDDTTYQEAMYNVRVKVSSRLAEQSKETKEITCLCCDKSYPLEQRLQNVSETFKIAVVYVHAPIKTRIFFPTRGRIVEAVRICRSTDRKGKRKWYIGRTATSCLYRALSLNYTMQEIETDLIKDTSLQMDRLESDKTESNEIVPWYRLLDQSDQAQIWMRSLDSDPPSKLMKEYYQRLPGMHMIELDIEVD